MANARAALDGALDRENVVVVYQPIHEVATRRVIAAEALMRQRRESGEIREAAILTKAAENAPREDMIDLDEILLDRAFAGAAQWRSDLRLHVIAEGVERESQLAALAELDCDAVQGFLLSRPDSGDPSAAPGPRERSV